jgi:hypothetical protein
MSLQLNKQFHEQEVWQTQAQPFGNYCQPR